MLKHLSKMSLMKKKVGFFLIFYLSLNPVHTVVCGFFFVNSVAKV